MESLVFLLFLMWTGLVAAGVTGFFMWQKAMAHLKEGKEVLDAKTTEVKEVLPKLQTVMNQAIAAHAETEKEIQKIRMDVTAIKTQRIGK